MQGRTAGTGLPQAPAPTHRCTLPLPRRPPTHPQKLPTLPLQAEQQGQVRPQAPAPHTPLHSPTTWRTSPTPAGSPYLPLQPVPRSSLYYLTSQPSMQDPPQPRPAGPHSTSRFAEISFLELTRVKITHKFSWVTVTQFLRSQLANLGKTKGLCHDSCNI